MFVFNVLDIAEPRLVASRAEYLLSTPYTTTFSIYKTEEEWIQVHSVNTITGIKSIFLMSISTPELQRRTHSASEICRGWRLQLLVDAVLIERKARGDLSKVNATWFIGSKFNLAGSHCSAVCTT